MSPSDFLLLTLETVREGFEPFCGRSQAPQGKLNPDSELCAHTQMRAQTPVELGRDLSQVVAAWGGLSSPLKAAILAIAHSSTRTTEDES